MRIRRTPTFEQSAETGVLASLTLDQLVRNILRRNMHGVFAADPPNLAEICGYEPRTVLWSEAERHIEGAAQALRGMGLRQGDIVAVRMPNSVDQLLTLCAIWRAGLVACPIPLTWRRREWVNALSLTAPKALITMTQIGSEDSAEVARQMAAKQFSIRFVGAFGDDAPDGVLPLKPLIEEFTDIDAELTKEAQLDTDRGEDVAVIHVMETDAGITAIPRSHASLMACALPLVTKIDLTQTDRILNTMMQGHLSGLVTGLVASLLSGASLHLHHPVSAKVLDEQARTLIPTVTIGPITLLNDLVSAGSVSSSCRLVGINAFGRNRVPANLRDRRKFEIIVSVGDLALLDGYTSETGDVLLAIGDHHINDANPGSPTVLSLIEPKKSPDDAGAERGSDVILAVRGGAAPDGPWLGPTQTFGNSSATAEAPSDMTILPLRFERVGNSQVKITSISPGLAAIGGLLLDIRALDRAFSRISGAEAAAVASTGEALAVGVVPSGTRAVEPDDIRSSLSDLSIADHKIPDQIASFVALPRRADGGIDREIILKKAANG
ncbi:MAG: class I adenylate-forming enzyme family protein [Pseudomonadota bacterium]